MFAQNHHHRHHHENYRFHHHHDQGVETWDVWDGDGWMPSCCLCNYCSLYPLQVMMMTMMMMAFRQIPTMTKSHHGGNMSLIGEVGFCHRHIPTIDNYNDEVMLGGIVGQLGSVKGRNWQIKQMHIRPTRFFIPLEKEFKNTFENAQGREIQQM